VRPKIAHLVQGYLQPTETFIHTALAHSTAFSPVVFTDVARNLEAFPITCVSAPNPETEADETGRTGRSRLRRALDYPYCHAHEIRRRGAALLHAHFGPVGYQALRLRADLALPLVVSFYGFDASQLPRTPVWRDHLAKLFREGDRFLALGRDMANRLQALGCPSHKVLIHHVGVDPDRIPFAPRQWPGEEEQVRLLFCGRLVEKKGVLHAVTAFARVADRWRSLVLNVVGDGPMRGELHRVVRGLDLEGRVRILGALSYEEMLDEMARAHLFVLPSVTAADGDMEGTPMVLMEAQASGLPVLSTRHADIPEVVPHGESGYLVAESDTESLADCMRCLLSHPDSWPTFGQAGRRHVERHYNVHRLARELDVIYGDLLGDRVRGPGKRDGRPIGAAAKLRPDPQAPPERRVPERFFLIICAGRTGSSYLVSCLNSHPHVLCYPEVMADQGPRIQARVLTGIVEGEAIERLDPLVRDRMGQMGLPGREKRLQALGFKVQLQYVHELVSLYQCLLDHDFTLIYLKRRNILKSVVSLLNMQRLLSVFGPGNSNAVHPDRVQGPIYVDPERFAAFLRERVQREEWHDRFYEAYEGDRQTFFYEDLLEDLDRFLDEVQRVLGLTPVPLVGSLYKNTPDRLSDAIVNYEEICGLVRGSPFERYLHE